jgi:hypothetical protein
LLILLQKVINLFISPKQNEKVLPMLTETENKRESQLVVEAPRKLVSEDPQSRKTKLLPKQSIVRFVFLCLCFDINFSFFFFFFFYLLAK